MLFLLFLFLSASLSFSHLIGTDRVITSCAIEGDDVVFTYDASILLDRTEEELAAMSVLLLRRNDVATSHEGLTHETLKGVISTKAAPGLHGYSVVVVDDEDNVVLLSDRSASMVVAPHEDGGGEEERKLRESTEGTNEPWYKLLEPITSPKLVDKSTVAPLADEEIHQCQLHLGGGAKPNKKCEHQQIYDYTFVIAARTDKYYGFRLNQNCVDLMMYAIARHNLNAEVLFVDYNSAPGTTPLDEIFAGRSGTPPFERVPVNVSVEVATPGDVDDAGDERGGSVHFRPDNTSSSKLYKNFPPLRIIKVPPAAHTMVRAAEDKKCWKLPLFEYHSKNIAFRRARGKVIVSGNADNIHSDSVYESLANPATLELLMNNLTMIRTYRVDMFEKLESWDSVHDRYFHFANWAASMKMLKKGFHGHPQLVSRDDIERWTKEYQTETEPPRSILTFGEIEEQLEVLRMGKGNSNKNENIDNNGNAVGDTSDSRSSSDAGDGDSSSSSSSSSSGSSSGDDDRSKSKKSVVESTNSGDDGAGSDQVRITRRKVVRTCEEHHLGKFVNWEDRNYLYGSGDFVAASAALWRTVRGYPEGCGQTEHDLYLLCIFIEYDTDIITWMLPCAASHQYHKAVPRTLVNIDTETLCVDLRNVKAEKGKGALAKAALFTQAYHTPFGEDWGLPEFEFEERFVVYPMEGQQQQTGNIQEEKREGKSEL